MYIKGDAELDVGVDGVIVSDNGDFDVGVVVGTGVDLTVGDADRVDFEKGTDVRTPDDNADGVTVVVACEGDVDGDINNDGDGDKESDGG